jgi:hypothetical protein
LTLSNTYATGGGAAAISIYLSCKKTPATLSVG